MFKSWFVVILLFVLSVCGFLEWLADFAPYYSFGHAKVANARLASRIQKPGRVSERLGENRFEYPLRFTTDTGKSIYAVSFAPQRAIDALARDGTVKILYLPDEPENVRFEGDVARMPQGWLSLLFGVAVLLVAIAAMRSRYRLAPYTKYFGRGHGGGDDD